MSCSDDIVALGTVVKDYTFEQVLGTGAFSAVYRASKVDEGGEAQTYAIKVIPKGNLVHEGDSDRLQRELDTMAFLNHPNIVRLYDFFSDAKYFYLVLDYCKGGDLAEYLMSQPPLREQQVATVFRQIVAAIGFLHEHGVAHRDLKPQNILITTFPNIKVADFGLCGYIEDTKMKTFCGSPCYTAPECLNRVQYEGGPADVWSLGVILYEMVTGHHPWNVTNIPKMVKQITSARYVVPSSVTPACDELIKGMLKLKPNERLSCERILGHPWMKLAPSRAAKMQVGKLPPLLRNSLVSFTQTIERDPAKADHGIVSPFEGRVPEQFADTMKPVTPPVAMPRSRSGSFAQGGSARTRHASLQPLQMRKSLGGGTLLDSARKGEAKRPIPLPRVATPH